MVLFTPHSPVTYKVKVLIADDSAFMRASLSRMVQSDDSLCVIGTAENGLEALAKISELHPDVVTLDLDMPGIDGMETLRRIMEQSPVPVIIVSSLARKGAAATLEALSLGAFDCVAKELSYATEDVMKVQAELVSKIKAAAGPLLRPSRLAKLQRPAPPTSTRSLLADEPIPAIVAIASSTGGPKALQELFAALPGDLPVGIVVVQHMPMGFVGPLAERLNDFGGLRVQEATNNDLIKRGRVYLAPAGQHMTVRRRSASEVVLRISPATGKSIHVPSADVMMSSVAEAFSSSAMGIVLTGMGNDGALGMRAIFQQGGITLGQDQGTCVVYGMPRACAELGVLSDVLPLGEIPGRILSALRYRKPKKSAKAGAS